MRRRLAFRTAWTVLQIFLAACLTPIQAGRTRPLNLEMMTERADRVFSGRCVNVRVARDPALDQVVTYVTFVPHRVEKGDVRSSLTIKILGDQDLDSPSIRSTEGVPAFRKGEEVVLFLYGDSRNGLTSPVGFGQGKFTVHKDKEGRPLASNQFANDQLFRNLSAGARKRLGDAVPKYQGKAIPPDDFLDLVRSLRR